MDDILASASGIVKRFAAGDAPALDGVDITVPRGRMTGLVGPDGAGKTTLIRILAGLIEPDEGETLVCGAPATRTDRSRLGYMPQRFGLYEDLTVHENLTLHSELHALPEEEHDARFAELMHLAALSGFEARLAGNLSGGMKQKLGLACALVGKPDLLLLDEPGVGVDPISRRELWAMVNDLAGEGIGVLWSTAYLEEAEKCDTVLLLSEGEALYHGPPAGFTERMAGRIYRMPAAPGHRRATLRTALDHPAVIDGIVQGDSIRLALAENAPPPAASALGGGDDAVLAPVAPGFEDGFFDVLGGRADARSTLAEAYRTIPDSDAPAIEAVGLTKRFGDFTAAHDVRFSVPRGQVFGLLGPNGAGKSTTFKMLCGLLTPSEGTGAVAGNDLTRARASVRQSLGYMSQQFSMYGHLSVRQNLDFFAGAYGLAGSAMREAIELAIETFGLARSLDINSESLPLGYKRRLAFACAVLHQPPVIFLDEPTSGVDPLVRREFWTHINGLVEKGVSVLVTTHFMEEAEYCDRIALIYRAEQIATGSPDELKARAGLPGAGMEDVFIRLIEQSETELEAA